MASGSGEVDMAGAVASTEPGTAGVPPAGRSLRSRLCGGCVAASVLATARTDSRSPRSRLRGVRAATSVLATARTLSEKDRRQSREHSDRSPLRCTPRRRFVIVALTLVTPLRDPMMPSHLARRSLVALAALVALTAPPLASSGSTSTERVAQSRSVEPSRTPPMAFEPNVGQTDSTVRYLARGAGYAVFLTSEGATLSVVHSATTDTHRIEPAAKTQARREAVALRIDGARTDARLVPEGRLAGTVNYLHGSDPKAWHRDLPTYATIRYEGLYDGVDAVFYGTQSALEYDFVVAPNADPSQIRVRFEGQRSAGIDASGDLVLRLANGEIRQQRAVVYQTDDGNHRTTVDAHYVLAADGGVRVEVAAYDRSRPLVIDPVIVYSTLVGGSQAADAAAAVAVDASGDMYVAGSTNALDFPVTNGAFQTANGANDVNDAFVAKLSADGSTILAATYLGGEADDDATGLALDPAGRVFVVGTTQSGNFPVSANAADSTFNGFTDIFVAALDEDLATLEYATYVGGGSYEGAWAAAFRAGGLYVAGYSYGGDFPTTPGAVDRGYAGQGDAIVMEIDTSDWSPVYATYLGGYSLEEARSIAVDASGQAVVTGTTQSDDLPTTAGAFDTTFSGFSNAFVTKLNAAGSAFVFSTFLGGGFDQAYAVAVDDDGAVYVSGQTLHPDFPTTPGAFQSTLHAGFWEGFVTKIAATGDSLGYSTFLGGSDNDFPRALTVDTSGEAFVVGSTQSADYPTSAGAYRSVLTGPVDATLSKISADGSALVYSTLLGGSEKDFASGVAVDGAGQAVVVGNTTSDDYPLVNAPSIGPPDHKDAILSRFSSDGSTLVSSTILGGRIGGSFEIPYDVAIDDFGAAYVVGATSAPDFPATPGAFDDTASDTEGFVSKLAADGQSVEFSTYVGGAEYDRCTGVFVSDQGALTIVGQTYSTNFPVTPGAFQSTLGGPSDFFVTRLRAAGDSLVFSTYLGGSQDEAPPALAVDSTGNVFVTGQSNSFDYPATPGAFDTAGSIFRDIVVSKVNSDGSGLIYSTYISGDQDSFDPQIVVDASGSAYVAGETLAPGFPTTPGAFDETKGQGQSVFVTKLTPDGSGLVYSTFLGGTLDSSSGGIAVDATGGAVVTGFTTTGDFPTTPGAFDTTLEVGIGGFVTKFDPSGSTLTFSTFLGSQPLSDVAIAADGTCFVVGSTPFDAFPVTPDATDPTFNGSYDGVVGQISADGSALLFGTYLGGAGDDEATAIALRDGGDIVVGGFTTSSGFGTATLGTDDGRSAFVLRIDRRPDAATDTPGVVDSATGAFFLRDSNTSGPANHVFVYGGGGLAPLAGDWDGDGVDTPGLYDPQTGFFFLKNTNDSGPADLVYAFGPGGLGWLPIHGDWNGDGVDTVGVYNPATSTFYLRNTHAPGGADLTFGFGAGGFGYEPLAGDFDGDGVDTVGLFLASTSVFFLKNSSGPGDADLAFGYGPAGAGWRPLIGDWNGDGADSVGLYVPGSGAFFLKNTNASGVADVVLVYGAPGAAPLAGNWDGQ